MKKVLLGILVLGAMISTASAQCSTYIVTTIELNIRDKPGKPSNIVGTVKQGDKVCIYDFSGKWGKIDKGWISGKHLSPVGSSHTSPKIDSIVKQKCSTYVVTTVELNIRDYPGKPSNILGTVKRGNKVCIYDFSGKWGKTDDGWISGKHLSLVGSSNTPYYKKISQKNLIVKSMNSFSDYIIKNTSDKACSFIFPNPYAYKDSPDLKDLYVKFAGKCKNYKQNKVKIYYKRKLFATYEGKIIKKGLPSEGILTFINGDKFEIGAYNGDYLISKTTVDDWLAGIHTIHKNIKNSINPDIFDIKLGINSAPTDVKANNYKLLGVGLHMTKTDNTIVLNYNIEPNDLSALTKSKYKLELEIKTTYKKTTVSFGIGMGKKQTAYDTVVIELDRINNYTASGTKKLREFTTYLESMGVRIILDDFKTDVKVLSLLAE